MDGECTNCGESGNWCRCDEAEIDLRFGDWQTKTLRWEEYPIGTEARESWTGCSWVKTERGWKAKGGDTFPYPASSDQVRLPEQE